MNPERGTAPTSVVEARYWALVEFIDTDFDKTNRVTKGAMQSLKEKITDWALAQEEIMGELKALNEEVKYLKSQKTPVATLLSCAAVATKSTDPKKVAIERAKAKPQTTIFLSSKKGEAIKKVKETFVKSVDPIKEKIQIKAIKSVGKVLIVETQSDTDAKKLIEHKKLKDLKCETAKKKKPLLLLYGVQQDLSNEHITDCIYEQNFSEHTTKQARTEG
jgi:hypothetical protein